MVVAAAAAAGEPGAGPGGWTSTLALTAAAGVATATLLAYSAGPMVSYMYDVVAKGNQGERSAFLKGNFAPTRHEAHGEAVIESGSIPRELDGVYLRNGPNPLLEPVANYHWFDGDGMVHATRIRGGKVFYSNNFVKTSRYQQERKAGKPLFLKFGDMRGLPALLVLMLSGAKKALGVTDVSEGAGTGNTALAFHARRLLALHEGDMPYHLRVLCNGIIETIGRVTLNAASPASAAVAAASYAPPSTPARLKSATPSSNPGTPLATPRNGRTKGAPRSEASDLVSESSCSGPAAGLPTSGWGGNSFTAHPKIDPATGEMMFIGYSVEEAPYCRAGVLTPAGELSRAWDIDLPWPVMMHDMGATANYLVVLHLPLVFDPKEITKGELPFVFQKDKPARIGLIPRSAPSATGKGAKPAVQWFEMPAFFTFHIANAWEEPSDGSVRIAAAHYERFTFKQMDDDQGAETKAALWEYKLQPSTGEASKRLLSSKCGDFPVVHPSRVCHKTKYTWMGTMETQADTEIAFVGISKFDLEAPKGKDALVGEVRYPPRCYGGEATFVPRHRNPKRGQEDDGWLMVYVHHEDEGVSKLHVYNAKTMDAKPVAVVRLPARVPYGFHGMFMTEEQIKDQIE